MWYTKFTKRVALKIVYYKIHQSLDFNELFHCGYQNIKSPTKNRRNPSLDGAGELDIDSKYMVLIKNIVDSGLYNHHFDLLLSGGVNTG